MKKQHTGQMERWSERRRMGAEADKRVADVQCTIDKLHLALMHGRTIAVPLAWYPRLLHATKKQRKNWQTCAAGYGIHSPDIDEDLSTEELLRGAPAPRPRALKT